MFYKLKCLTIKNRAVGHDDIALCAVIFALCARYIVLSDNEIALRAVIFALCAIYIVLSDNDIAAKPQLRNIKYIIFESLRLFRRGRRGGKRDNLFRNRCA